MSKSRGEAVTDNGAAVTSESKFTAESANGTATMTFSFNSINYANDALVVFEDLYYGDDLIAQENDLENADQTVFYDFPADERFTTVAVDASTLTHTGKPSANSGIVETINYSGLVPGMTYTFKSSLVKKSDGKPAMYNGEAITQETTFVADADTGTKGVYFVFDSTVYMNDTLVVFEELVREDDGELVYYEKDINNDEQSVYYPGIGTLATVNESHTGIISQSTTLVDKVFYTGLQPGHTYTLKGCLMEKDTGMPLRINGGYVTVSFLSCRD